MTPVNAPERPSPMVGSGRKQTRKEHGIISGVYDDNIQDDGLYALPA